MTDAEIYSTARHVAGQILAQVSPTADKYAPQTWIDAADRLGCRVFRLRGDSSGEGHYDFHAPGGPSIFYMHQPDDHPYWVCCRIVHELAHHWLVSERGSNFPKAWERYDDNRETVQHRIARMVEDFVYQKKEC
jgi:hypothetical protein